MKFTRWSSDDKRRLKVYFYEGRSDEEIANLLGRTLATVIVHRHQFGLKKERKDYDNTPVPLPPCEVLNRKYEYIPETGELLFKECHVKSKIGTSATYLRPPPRSGQLPYLIVRIDGRRYMAHRVIYKMMTGRDPTELIDHKDGDSTNNRWENLREATRAENARNRCVNYNSKTGLKRVHQTPQGKWTAVVSLGVFETKEEASAAYELAASKVYGEFYRPSRQTSIANDNAQLIHRESA